MANTKWTQQEFWRLFCFIKFYQGIVFYYLTCSLNIYNGFWFVFLWDSCMYGHKCLCVYMYFMWFFFDSFSVVCFIIFQFDWFCFTLFYLLLFFRCLFFLTRKWIFEWEVRWRGSGMSWERKHSNQSIAQEK